MDDLPGLDLERLARWASDAEPGLWSGPLTAELLTGGRSNLTYLVRGAHSGVAVLRRPPVGPIPQTAHDMARESRVLRGLAATSVPVPEVYAEFLDPGLLGAPFYLMSYVEGRVLRQRADVADLPAAAKADLANAVAATLADIHAVDARSAGLAGLGRPAGYLARQVERWRRHLDVWGSASRSRLVAVADRLTDQIPQQSRNTLVHGDFRLDNVIVADDLEIAAVVDWEMATLGDPLADLGLLLVYWDVLGAVDNGVATSMGPAAGFPAGAHLVDRYAEASGADVGAIDWYVALAAFKLAVVLEGVRARDQRGEHKSGGSVAEVIPVLVAQAEALL